MNKRNNPSNAGDETPNIKDEPQQPTLQNADYKMTVSSVQQWYNILNIRHYEHLYEAYHIHWADTMDKSGDTLLETKIKIAELPPNRKEKKKTKEPKDTNNFNEIYVLLLYHTTNMSLIQQTTETNRSITNTPF